MRLLGLSTENASGITYEAAGINGAEASLFLRWNDALQEPLLAAVNPALVVLAYGTNEASDRNWTEESYAAMFTRIVERIRRAAPSASILVVGPPDRALRVGPALVGAVCGSGPHCCGAEGGVPPDALRILGSAVADGWLWVDAGVGCGVVGSAGSYSFYGRGL